MTPAPNSGSPEWCKAHGLPYSRRMDCALDACPNCKGSGYTMESGDVYPELKTKFVSCLLCESSGRVDPGCKCFMEHGEVDPCNCEVPGHCPPDDVAQPEPEYHELEPADVLEIYKTATEDEP